MNLIKIPKFSESLFWSYITTLKKDKSKNIYLVLALMIFTSLTEGISILLLIPLLQIVGLNVQQGSISQISEYSTAFFNYLGITPTLTIVLIIYIIVVSINAIIIRFQSTETSRIQFEFAATLRKRLFSKITTSNWIFITRNKSSDFAHALTNEIERISYGTGQFLAFIASIMILIVYIIFALQLAGILTGIIFLIGVMIILSLRRMVVRSKTSGENITTTTQDLYSFIMQHLDGIKTIKSFGIEKENTFIFSQQTNEVSKNYLYSIKSYADVKLLFDIGTVIVLSIIVLILIEVIKIPSASLFLLIYIFVRTIPQFSTVQYSYQYFLNMLPAYGSVMRLEKECADNSEPLGMENCQIEFKKVINLDNISFSYKDEEHLFIKDMSMQIPVGKTIAIVGKSGAGKSTIADLIMGLIKPLKGKITIDDISLSNNFITSWRNQIGYVSQDTFLFNESIKFNLRLSKSDADNNEIIEALKLAAAYDFVSKLPEGIDTIIGDRGVRLSGGERQRLALARALLRKPSLLILDEATSNIDSYNEKRILNAINNLHGTMSILIIAHRVTTIKNSDYIYRIEYGQILDFGTYKEIFQ